MTYEKASDGIKTWLGAMRKANEGNDFANEFIDCAEFMTKSVVREASEKQIPQYPEYTDEYMDDAYCPACGKFEFERGTTTWGMKYCPECGQAIDWSEEDEK